jgi:hypothetical protein
MEEQSFQCVKCGAAMVKGYAADRGDANYFTLKWADGEPAQAQFLGITGDNIKYPETPMRAVRGLRCERCGYLELYAV